MARDFTKNTSNHLSLGIGSLGALINGAAKISAHVLVNFDTIETSNNTNDRMLEILINSNATGFTIASNAPDLTTPVLRIGARSAAGDSFQTRLGTTPLTTGTWLSLGGVVDFSGATITPYYQGAAENGGAVSFGNSSYTQGTPTEADTIGGHFSPPPDINVQVDGREAELTLWNDDIGPAGFAALASGVSALSVRRDALIFHMRLLGDNSPEIAEVSGVTGSITGSIPQAAHPNVFTLAGPSLFRGRGFSFFDDEEVNRFEFWPAVGGAIDLVVQDATHAHTADSPTLTQQHELVVQSATHAHASENVAVTQVHGLEVNDATHSHTAENVVVTQAHALTVQDAVHDHSADNVVLTQVHELTVEDATHAHSADNVVPTQQHGLTVDSATHAHEAENVVLTQAHALVVQSAEHAHTAENVTPTQVHELSVDNTTHAHTADNVEVDQAIQLVVQDAVHDHTADSLVLTQAHGLAVDDTTHAHTAETPALTQTHVLAVQNSTHAHAAENVTLEQGVQLVVDDAVHAHSAANVILTQLHQLVVASTIHAHTASNVTVTSGQIATPPRRTFVVQSANRIFTVKRKDREYVVIEPDRVEVV